MYILYYTILYIYIYIYKSGDIPVCNHARAHAIIGPRIGKGVVWGEGSLTEGSVLILLVLALSSFPSIKRHSAYLECPAPPRPSD